MDKVTVLIEGYARETKDGWLATSSVTLVETDKHKIIVDPGIYKALLIEKLSTNKIDINDIDYIFLTHYHPDHSFLASIFSRATIFDGSTAYKDDNEVEYSNTLPDTDIGVIQTPGHAHEHASLVVKTSDLGTVIVAGDLFWWTDQEKQNTGKKSLLNKEDPFTKDRATLVESRKAALEIADWVIPGHGKMFQVKR